MSQTITICEVCNVVLARDGEDVMNRPYIICSHPYVRGYQHPPVIIIRSIHTPSNGQKIEIIGITDEMVEHAAQAMNENRHDCKWPPTWERLHESLQERFRIEARAGLVAAFTQIERSPST